MERESINFIPGVYNYCDRWCERCRFWDRCRVYDMEIRRNARHIEEGEDPYAVDVALQDVADSMRDTMEMIGQMAEEMGIDVVDTPAEDDLESPYEMAREHPLAEQAMRWMKRVNELLQRIRTDVPGLGLELAKRLEEVPDGDLEKVHGETLERFAEVRDAYEVLGQYRMFVAVKLTRALGAKGDAERRPDPEMAGYSMDDANGTAKVAHECLSKSIDALWSIAEFDRKWQEIAMPLIMDAESIRASIDRSFPGHVEFKRPGFEIATEESD